MVAFEDMETVFLPKLNLLEGSLYGKWLNDTPSEMRFEDMGYITLHYQWVLDSFKETSKDGDSKKIS